MPGTRGGIGGSVPKSERPVRPRARIRECRTAGWAPGVRWRPGRELCPRGEVRPALEAWWRPGAGALVTAGAFLLGPSGGNPKEERERIRGLGGRLELVLRSWRGAVDQCRSPTVRAAREGLTQSGGERC
ncbi:hypothetical protein NDU88_003254 [Pleurodeles waltl]|uniref:Uncharacterized protein n=1 Tax=Pleurodeles waltl TaxID=8319 RepID=A0AAV7W6V2_PLEWA|nr:hypothetical protein NDU88_003254 [Pleurodeles waltl]